MNQHAKDAFAFGALSAGLLVALWLVISLIGWDFSVSLMSLRILLIFTVLTIVGSYIYLKHS
jgi:hypothetical protein